MSKTVDFVIEEAQYIASKKARDTLSEPERARAELVVRLWEKGVKPLIKKSKDIAGSGSRFRIQVYTDGTHVCQERAGGKTIGLADKLPVPDGETIYRRDHLCFVLMSLTHYKQDLKADTETDPRAAEVDHAMSVVAAWLGKCVYEADERTKKGLSPRRPRPRK